MHGASHPSMPSSPKMPRLSSPLLTMPGDLDDDLSESPKCVEEIDTKSVLEEFSTDVGSITPSSGKRRRCHKVWVHVYDIDTVTAKMNRAMLRDWGVGAFHAGVEVLGDEWFFHFGNHSDSGVVWMEPRGHQVHIYSESVCLGESALSEDEIREVIADFMEMWPANTYHPVKRNCIDFAEALIEALQCPQAFPAWIRGLPDAAKSPAILPIADYTWDWVKWWNNPAEESRSEGSSYFFCSQDSICL
eukprot:TRINITY_DN95732_c0_g1_i1.p1 TRINITY_DN95732_c0_g1~~TRINITY_DN95732_c0_g1_i1.p1  ORF type:complete len:246 (-),score=30.93 TRINITY_DN95732_c0_g1_i1:64-801(-)